jgi:hypothetical protein
MAWNYRVLAFKDKKSGEVELQISDVYYDYFGKPYVYGKFYAASTDGIEGLKWILDRQREALDKPILWGDERFPQEFNENEKL